jgi:quercetin dioxygenase-like cupin family protein
MGFPVYGYRSDVRNVLVTPQIRSRFLRMEPGEESGAHSHDLGHEVFLVLQGRAEFTIDGETEELGPGEMCVALVDQLHSLRVVGDEPMTMYLSVTPHVQPTHTMWDEHGLRLPHRFTPSSAYGVETDTDTPIPDLLGKLAEATRSVAAAAHDAAAVQAEQAGTLARALSRGDEDAAADARSTIWDALMPVFQQTEELASLWNDVAPRAGST